MLRTIQIRKQDQPRGKKMPGPHVQQLPGGGGLTPVCAAWIFLSYLMPYHIIQILSLGPCILHVFRCPTPSPDTTRCLCIYIYIYTVCVYIYILYVYIYTVCIYIYIYIYIYILSCVCVFCRCTAYTYIYMRLGYVRNISNAGISESYPSKARALDRLSGVRIMASRKSRQDVLHCR